MPLNYSKWDQLELSDDSDIEGHPNVDKRSLIRWKQRDIHEKREARKSRTAQLEAEIACNDVLLERLRVLNAEVAASGAARFSSEVERLRTSPSPDAPRSNAPNPMTYDAMILSLLDQVAAQSKEKSGGDREKLENLLETGLQFHVKKLGETIDSHKEELKALEKEKLKHITAEDMHEGFESKYIPAKPEPPPVVKPKPATTKTTTDIEVLNPAAPYPPSAASSSSTASASTSSADDLDELPEMTPALEEFARLPLWDFEKSWEFIQNHREVVVPGASDALLVAAFTNQTNGHAKLAKQCVHQSLLLQYGDKLGKDGLRLFFKRMISGGAAAHAIFRKDVEDSYAHVQRRVDATQQEQEAEGEREQIQLVAENPGTSITFNVPEGPPPENITLEGPGTEDLDIEEVRKALQMRWDLFSGLSPRLQNALKSAQLEEVNKVLGKMSVEEAEGAVNMMNMGGILSFAEEGIRDLTNKADEEEDDDADDANVEE